MIRDYTEYMSIENCNMTYSKEDFTMDGTPCHCKGSSILSKKVHPFRGGMNCDQTILIKIIKTSVFI